MSERRRCLVSVHDVDRFADPNVSQEGQGGAEGGEGILICHGDDWTVVHFDGVGYSREVSNSCSFGFVIVGVGMGDDDDLVALVAETNGKAVDMHFYSAKPGVEEVTYQCYVHAMAVVEMMMMVIL